MNALLIATVIATGEIQTMGFSNIVYCWEYVRQHEAQETYQLDCIPTPTAVGNAVSSNFYDTARIINLINGIQRKLVDE